MINRSVDLLKEPFKSRYIGFLSACNMKLTPKGYKIYTGETLREYATQLVYFLQGLIGYAEGVRKNSNLVNEYHKIRKALGIFPVSDYEARSKTITWTLDSNHFTGFASDILVYKDEKPVWDKTDPVWKEIADIAKVYKLESGYYWTGGKQDPPHIELPLADRPKEV